jgi:hypothetical protein
MSRPKFHKLYFPGLISLIFLPLMCICCFLSNNVFHKYRVMEIASMSKAELNKYVSSRHGIKFDVETFRKYKVLTLIGNSKHDSRELSELKILLTELNIADDTVNGVKVALGSHTQYGEVVNALDICFQTNNSDQLWFDLMGNQILIGHDAPPPPKGTKYLYNDVFLNNAVNAGGEQSFFSIEHIYSNFTFLIEKLIEFWPSVLIFILMLRSTLFKGKRYFNLRTFRLADN